MKRNKLIENNYAKALKKPACTECGKDISMSIPAYVYWDEYEQDWVMDEIDYDRIFCNECDTEQYDLDFGTHRPLPRELKIEYSVRRRKEEQEFVDEIGGE
jgi:hypothetical protein